MTQTQTAIFFVNFKNNNLNISSNGRALIEGIAPSLVKKIEIIKFRRRKHSRTQAGHRQSYTEIEVTDIKA